MYLDFWSFVMSCGLLHSALRGFRRPPVCVDLPVACDVPYGSWSAIGSHSLCDLLNVIRVQGSEHRKKARSADSQERVSFRLPEASQVSESQQR